MMALSGSGSGVIIILIFFTHTGRNPQWSWSDNFKKAMGFMRGTAVRLLSALCCGYRLVAVPCHGRNTWWM
jgi:hypothetical protein